MRGLVLLVVVLTGGCAGEFVVGGDAGTGGACDGTQQACGSACVDLQSDPDHCGACGNVCAAGEACVDGGCAQGCVDSATLCDRRCVDLDSDSLHCGSCDNACRLGRQCEAGECEDFCGESCDENTEICDRGTCVCRPGFLRCSGACVNTGSDPAHCGDCGVSCGAMPCGGSSCQADCGGFPAQCGLTCTDLQTDPMHCGECGEACDSDELCVSGDCRDIAFAPCTSCPCEGCGSWSCCQSDVVGATLCVNDSQCP